jgi:hypothetical protein
MPAYSTDKGFTGNAGGFGGGGSGGGSNNSKDKNKNKGNKPTGGLFGDASVRDRSNAALDPKGSRSQAIGKELSKGGAGKGAGFVPDQLVPQFSRQKVQKHMSRPPTAGNIITGALTALGIGPATAIGTVAGSEEVTGVEGGLMKDLTGLGYEGPIGEAEHINSDPSQLGENKSLKPDGGPTKKKKNNPLGNQAGTLLADAGGTLVAG